MRVLLVTLKVGAGLITMCEAVKEQLDIMGAETLLIDIYKDEPQRAYFSSEFYYKTVNKIPRLLGLIQKVAYHQSLRAKNNHFYCNVECRASKKIMLDYLEKFKPDVVYTNLNFVALALDELKAENKMSCPYLMQIPDFLTPYYVQTLKHAQYVCASCDETMQVLLKHGYKNKDTLVNVGIPVRQKFLNIDTKDNLIAKLGLPSTKNIVISNGGQGAIDSLKIVRTLAPKLGEYTLIVINGNNANAKQQIDDYLSKNNIKNIINLGFVTNIEEYLRCAEILVGKCGASTLCEASALGVAFIAYNNLFYPEIENIRHLQKHNACTVVRNAKQIIKQIESYIQDKIPFWEKQKNFAQINNKFASIDVANLIAKAYNDSINK